MNLTSHLCFIAGIIAISFALTLEDLRKEHVVISGPENITAYYTSSDNIIVGWDLRQSYVPHDVTPQNYSMLKHGDEIKASKPQIHLVAVNKSLINETSPAKKNQTESTSEVAGKGNSTTQKTPPADNTGTDKNDFPDSESDNKDSTGQAGSNNGDNTNKEGTAESSSLDKGAEGTATDANKDQPQSDQPASLPSESEWVCRPATYFSNFTVSVNDDPGPFNNGWSTTLLNTDVTLADLSIKLSKELQQKMVIFEYGCVTKFKVTYQPKVGRSVEKTVEVDPTHRMANITGLREATTYSITVQAVYVNDVLSSQPLFVRTRKTEEEPKCLCDWHGTVNLRSSCKIGGDGKLCNCRSQYQGRFCEQCAPGYFRTAPYFPCNKCPCEEFSSKSSSCHFVEGFLLCDQCEEGYIGNVCHKCKRGYYRHGKHCINCACSGNANPKNDQMCKAESGECVDCIHNTTGFNCERCLTGYEGEAVTFKNCTLTSDLNGRGGHQSDSGGSLSPGVIAAVVVIFLVCITICVGFIMFKRLRTQQQRRAFWTVEMRRDKDDVDFNSVQNDEAHLDDLDDLEFYEHHGGTTSGNKYSRLNEQI